MESTQQRVGRTIRQVRSRRQLTQSEAAKRAGLSGSYWALIEQGRRTPNLEVLEQMGEALGVPASILVFLASDMGKLEKLDRSIAERLALLSWRLIEAPSEHGVESV